MTKRRFLLQPLERRMLLAGDMATNDRSADLNLDGIVDAADVRLIVDYLASEQAAAANASQDSLDLNGDGKVSAADALRVINRIGSSEPTASSELIVAEGAGPEISILDAEVVEGNAGVTTIQFTVALSEVAPGPVSVNVSLVDDSAAGLRSRTPCLGPNQARIRHHGTRSSGVLVGCRANRANQGAGFDKQHDSTGRVLNRDRVEFRGKRTWALGPRLSSPVRHQPSLVRVHDRCEWRVPGP